MISSECDPNGRQKMIYTLYGQAAPEWASASVCCTRIKRGEYIRPLRAVQSTTPQLERHYYSAVFTVSGLLSAQAKNTSISAPLSPEMP
jgi:hypothetical protein